MYDFTKISNISLIKASNSVMSFKPPRPQSSDGKKFLTKFWEEIKLSEANEKVILLAGSYKSLIDGNVKQWKEKLAHETMFIPGKPQGTIICSAGHDPNDKHDCVGCVLYENGPKRDNPWYPKVKVTFNAVSLAAYHDNLPYINKEGKPQIGKDNKPLFIKGKCTGKNCVSCKQYGKPALFGRLMKLTFTGAQFAQLMSFNKKLENICAGCGYNIVINDYSCQSCGELLLDVANSSYPDEYIASFAANIQKCKCGANELPIPGLDCGYDVDGINKINEECPLKLPMPMNIFTSVIDIRKEEKILKLDKASILDNSRIKYKLPGNVDIKDVIEAAIKANNNSLFDLDAETFILPTDEQAKILGVENPCNVSNEVDSAPAIPHKPMGIPKMISMG